jgi:hypothetical protein
MGENVPMNIWLTDIDRTYAQLFKAYFFKDLINQCPTGIDEIVSILLDGPYDMDDGTEFDMTPRCPSFPSRGNGNLGRALDKIRNDTRLFKITVDNDCWERWFMRYLNVMDGVVENAKQQLVLGYLVNIYSFAEELKSPHYLKDYMEPVKAIPTKMAARMNKGSKLMSHVMSGDTTPAVMASQRIKSMKYLCSEEGQKLIDKKAVRQFEHPVEAITLESLERMGKADINSDPRLNGVVGTVDSVRKSLETERAKEETRKEIERQDKWTVALFKRRFPGAGVLYAKPFAPFSTLRQIGKTDDALNMEKLSEYEFDDERTATEAAGSFNEKKKFYLDANCCFEDRGYANEAHTRNLMEKFNSICVSKSGKCLTESEIPKDKGTEEECKLYNRQEEDYTHFRQDDEIADIDRKWKEWDVQHNASDVPKMIKDSMV